MISEILHNRSRIGAKLLQKDFIIAPELVPIGYRKISERNNSIFRKVAEFKFGGRFSNTRKIPLSAHGRMRSNFEFAREIL